MPSHEPGRPILCQGLPGSQGLQGGYLIDEGTELKWAARLHHMGRQILMELAYCRCVLTHPRTPRPARWILGAAIAYAASPIDLIPDFIPILGHLDDVLVLPLLTWLAFRLVPRDVMTECRKQREDIPMQRVQKGAAQETNPGHSTRTFPAPGKG